MNMASAMDIPPKAPPADTALARDKTAARSMREELLVLSRPDSVGAEKPDLNPAPSANNACLDRAIWDCKCDCKKPEVAPKGMNREFIDGMAVAAARSFNSCRSLS